MQSEPGGISRFALVPADGVTTEEWRALLFPQASGEAVAVEAVVAGMAVPCEFLPTQSGCLRVSVNLPAWASAGEPEKAPKLGDGFFGAWQLCSGERSRASAPLLRWEGCARPTENPPGRERTAQVAQLPAWQEYLLGANAPLLGRAAKSANFRGKKSDVEDAPTSNEQPVPNLVRIPSEGQSVSTAAPLPSSGQATSSDSGDSFEQPSDRTEPGPSRPPIPRLELQCVKVADDSEGSSPGTLEAPPRQGRREDISRTATCPGDIEDRSSDAESSATHVENSTPNTATSPVSAPKPRARVAERARPQREETFWKAKVPLWYPVEGDVRPSRPPGAVRIRCDPLTGGFIAGTFHAQERPQRVPLPGVARGGGIWQTPAPLHECLSYHANLPTPPLDGSKLRLLQKIGSGFFASVYHGLLEGRPVAVKIQEPHASGEDSRMALHRATQEWKILSRLNHPNVVQFRGAVVRNREVLLVTELVNGGDLWTLLTRRSPVYLRSSRRFEMIRQLAEVVAHLHERRVVHKDLKSLNVLVAEELSVKLCDFGDAEELSGSERLQWCTAATWPYAPPEMILCDDPCRPDEATCKVDIWALGCVILELCRQPLPYTAVLRGVPEASHRDRLRQLLLTGRLQPKQVVPPLPPCLQMLVRRCLSFHTEGRASAREVLHLVVRNGEAMKLELAAMQVQWDCPTVSLPGLKRHIHGRPPPIRPTRVV